MSRNVFCVKLKKEAPGLAMPPMPGDRGQWLFNNVCQEAWQAWLQHQTRLINEKHLNLMEPDTRKYLAEQMDKFFNNEAYDQAEGYTPEQDS